MGRDTFLGPLIASPKNLTELKFSSFSGGWSHEYEPRFSRMSATAEGRQTFIQSVIAFLKKHNVDGVSYNWIYPGTRG